MSIVRTAALVLASTTLIAASALALSLAAPREARAQATQKQLKVTFAGGMTRTGPMSISPVTCNVWNGAISCGVTVSNPAGPMTHPPTTNVVRPVTMGMLGCTFVTRSAADARAIAAQLADPTTAATVTCGDTSAQGGPPPNAYIIPIDVTNVKSTQSFSF